MPKVRKIDKILAYVKKHPKATGVQCAKALGVAPNYVYVVLKGRNKRKVTFSPPAPRSNVKRSAKRRVTRSRGLGLGSVIAWIKSVDTKLERLERE